MEKKKKNTGKFNWQTIILILSIGLNIFLFSALWGISVPSVIDYNMARTATSIYSNLSSLQTETQQVIHVHMTETAEAPKTPTPYNLTSIALINQATQVIQTQSALTQIVPGFPLDPTATAANQ